MSLSLSRRASHRSEATQQLIVFRVWQEWFALPIQVAYRVIPIGQVYGACPQGSVSLTRYQDQDVLVLDVQRRIFGEKTPSLLPGHTPDEMNPLPERHLLLLHSPEGELVGIPLDHAPILRRVPVSAFKPVPPMYLAEGTIRCIGAIVVTPEGEPPLFLLNPAQLLQNPTALPASE